MGEAQRHHALRRPPTVPQAGVEGEGGKGQIVKSEIQVLNEIREEAEALAAEAHELDEFLAQGARDGVPKTAQERQARHERYVELFRKFSAREFSIASLADARSTFVILDGAPESEREKN